jgi:hypothetical protein
MGNKKKEIQKNAPNLTKNYSKKLFGIDIKQIGAAIASAVIAEIAQAVLKQISKSTDAQEPVEIAEAVNINPIRAVVNGVQSAISEVQPALAVATDVSAEVPDLVYQSTNAANHIVNNKVGERMKNSKDTARLIEETVKQVMKEMSSQLGTTKHQVEDKAETVTTALKTKFESLQLDADSQKLGKKAKHKSKKKKKQK